MRAASTNANIEDDGQWAVADRVPTHGTGNGRSGNSCESEVSTQGRQHSP